MSLVKLHTSPFTSHVCLLICDFAQHYLGMEISCCQLRFSTSLTLSVERESVSNSDLSVPAPPTGQSDSGSSSSLVAIVISPASPASKPPRNQTSQGGLYCLPAHGVTWHKKLAHSSSLLIRALIWLGLYLLFFHSLTQFFYNKIFSSLARDCNKECSLQSTYLGSGMHVASSFIWLSPFLSRCNDCLNVY